MPALHNVARLSKPTPEKVKKAIIQLHDARPPFSYEPLYEGVWTSVRLREPVAKYRRIVEDWQPSVRRSSYLRALRPTEIFFDRFEHLYQVDIVPRPYSIGRGLQASFAPRALCGTDYGPTIPWLLFWKHNPLTEEQTALLHCMALDAFSADPDLESATLMLVDTSIQALGEREEPGILTANELPLISPERMRAMLDVFAAGYMMAQEELRGRAQAQMVSRKLERAAQDSKDDQLDLFF